MTVTIRHTTPADGSFSSTGAAAWDAIHQVSSAVATQIVFGGAAGELAQSPNLTWGDASSTLVAGNLIISTAVIVPGAVNNVALTAGSGLITSTGPTIVISGGAGATSGTFNGGLATLIGGYGSGSAGEGGIASVIGGDGSGTGVAGSAFVNGGFSPSGSGGGVFAIGGNAGPSAVNGTGGQVFISSGNGGGISGNPGQVDVFAGSVTGSTGVGGSITLGASNGVGAASDGGNINLSVGTKAGSGIDGYVNFTAASRAYGLATGTNTITITALGPAGITSATISLWLPVKVDGLLYATPLWRIP